MTSPIRIPTAVKYNDPVFKDADIYIDGYDIRKDAMAGYFKYYDEWVVRSQTEGGGTSPYKEVAKYFYGWLDEIRKMQPRSVTFFFDYFIGRYNESLLEIRNHQMVKSGYTQKYKKNFSRLIFNVFSEHPGLTFYCCGGRTWRTISKVLKNDQSRYTEPRNQIIVTSSEAFFEVPKNRDRVYLMEVQDTGAILRPIKGELVSRERLKQCGKIYVNPVFGSQKMQYISNIFNNDFRIKITFCWFSLMAYAPPKSLDFVQFDCKLLALSLLVHERFDHTKITTFYFEIMKNRPLEPVKLYQEPELSEILRSVLSRSIADIVSSATRRILKEEGIDDSAADAVYEFVDDMKHFRYKPLSLDLEVSWISMYLAGIARSVFVGLLFLKDFVVMDRDLVRIANDFSPNSLEVYMGEYKRKNSAAIQNFRESIRVL